MSKVPASRSDAFHSAFPQTARIRIQPPGQRILRSVISVWLCMVVYVLRGMRGEPFYSIIAALQCVQPYSSNMLREGKDRIIGTLVGAFWGSAILFLELLPVGGDFRTTVVFYILLGIFTGLVIYSTVLLNISQYALFAAVVFLGIAVYHIEDANPFIHVFYRTLETIIGVGVAILVNSLHLPRVRDRETLFVSGIDHVLFREDRELSRFTKVELNRFLHDGMRFSVSTMQTPATVREILSGVDLRLPFIAMDGAVRYDLHTMKYVRTVKIEPALVSLITDFLHAEGIPFFVNTVQDIFIDRRVRPYIVAIGRDPLFVVKPGHGNISALRESQIRNRLVLVLDLLVLDLWGRGVMGVMVSVADFLQDQVFVVLEVDDKKVVLYGVDKKGNPLSVQKIRDVADQSGLYFDCADVFHRMEVIEDGAVHRNDGETKVDPGQDLTNGGWSLHGGDGASHAVMEEAVELNLRETA